MMHKTPLVLIIALLVVPLLMGACQPIQPPTPIPAIPSATPKLVEADPTADPTADRLLQEGIEYFGAAEYDKAIAAYTEAIRLNPDLAAAYTKRAAAYLRLGDFEAAIPDCDAAIRLNPNDADAYLFRGISYTYLDDFEMAISDLTEAIRLNDQSVDALVYRSAAYFLVGRYAATVQDCTDAVKLSGGYFLPAELCLTVMGHIVSPDFDDLEAAIQDYDEAIQVNPDFAAAYLFRGLTKRSLGDIEAAIMDLEEALRLDPFLSDLLIMYWSIAYTAPVDSGAAVKELESALSLVEPGSVLANIIEIPLTQLRSGQ